MYQHFAVQSFGWRRIGATVSIRFSFGTFVPFGVFNDMSRVPYTFAVVKLLVVIMTHCFVNGSGRDSIITSGKEKCDAKAVFERER
jgi:hypothetical protein